MCHAMPAAMRDRVCSAMPCLLQSVTVVLAAVLLSQDAATGGVVRLMLKVGLYLPFMFGLLLAASGATGL